MSFSPPDDLSAVRPRPRFIFHRVKMERWALMLRVERQDWNAIRDHFTPGALVVKWWSWRVLLWAGRSMFVLTRWREEWGTYMNEPR
jgi:hypothetical protein